MDDNTPQARPIRWGIAGVGIAGRARGRAMLADPGADLVGVWRGRNAIDLGVPSMGSLGELLEVCEAVAICSPDALHADQVEQALHAGRHVVVEYPLASDAQQAARLFALARRQRVVLHVEHIELLTPQERVLAEALADDPPVAAHVGFTGRSTHPLRNIARLHRIAHLFGCIAALDRVQHTDALLFAAMRTTRDTRVVLQAQPGRRSHSLAVRTARHEWHREGSQLLRDGVPVDLPDSGGLFATDHQVASQRIREGGQGYVRETRVLHVLEWAQRMLAAAERCTIRP